jgi:SAM-dependent methyltransferase
VRDLLGSPDPIRDVRAYEQRRYPPGYFTRFKRQQDIRTLHESIGPGPLTVLDLPCGSGRLMGPMMARRYRVVGSDLSWEMLQEGRRRLGAEHGLLGLVRSDVRRLPFRDGAFDMVVCMRFLYYFETLERIRLLREMSRVARRYLLLQYRVRSTFPAFLWRVRYRAGITSRDRSRRCLAVSEIRREVEKAGPLRIVRVRPVSIWFSDRAYILCARKD